MTVDVSQKDPNGYGMETLFPEITGALSRQDDRYHTVPYRYGYFNGFSKWVVMDHQTKTAKSFSLPDTGLAEVTFVPRSAHAPEGDGYLIGVATKMKEGGRSDLLIVDTQHLDEGPIATVHMPYRVVGQVHGFWVRGDQLPKPRQA